MGFPNNILVVKKELFHFILLIVALIAELLFFNTVQSTQVIINILKFELLFLYIYVLKTAKTHLQWTSIYMFFLFFLGVFEFSRVFLDILGLYHFEWANKFKDFYFPKKTQVQILSYLILSLAFIHLGFYFSFFKKRNIRSELKPELKLGKIALILFIISFPGIFVKYLIQFKFILKNGYVAVYNGELNHLTYPIWTYGAGTLMVISFCIFLASKPTKRKFLIVSALFFLLKTADVLKGGRSKLFLPIIFIVWYYFMFYSDKKLKIWKIVVFVILGIAISQFILLSRNSNNVAYGSDILFIKLFFAQQGISLLVLGYMIYYKNSFVHHGLPYILYPLTVWGKLKGQTYEFVQHTLSLGHKLTYFLSPPAYLSGQGIGSSYLGELYDLGIVGFVLGSFIIGYFIIYFESKVRYNRIWLVLSFFIVESIVYMPRASIFPDINNIIVVLMAYFVLKGFSDFKFQNNPQKL